MPRFEPGERTRVALASVLGGDRRTLNLIAGANASIEVADDPANEEVDVTIGVSGTGSLPLSGSAGTGKGWVYDAGLGAMVWTDLATQAELDAAVGLPRALTGAVSATRYVGGVASVAPTTGTFAAGDFVVALNGTVFVCVTAGSPGTWTRVVARSQLAQTAAGVISENYPPYVATSSNAPTSQVVFGYLLGLRAGDVVTGILLRSAVAAAGTAPTTARFGIANSAGVILALSGNINAAASWPVGGVLGALTAPYTVLADGGYFACFVVNGTWGTTQPTLNRTSGLAGSGAVGGNVTPSFSWAGQTDLPAVGNSLTMTSLANGQYIGFY
jgi:hypothetical protein